MARRKTRMGGVRWYRSAALMAIGCWLQWSTVAAAAPAGATTPDSASLQALLPLPAPAAVKQVTHLDGKLLSYTATVGALPVRDETGRPIAEMVSTAYMLKGSDPLRRPVTFVFNGGPGAASVFLQLGAVGPKRVAFGGAADSPSNTPELTDNPGTWLDFTDLVFVDPVGTGFSRSLVGEADSTKYFWGAKQDIQYLSRFIYDWLSHNGRLQSPKYLAGESYGGYRVPKLAYDLQTRLGVGIRGAVLISPALDTIQEFDPAFSPLPWMIALPSLAAAKLEHEGHLDAEHMAPAIAYARNEYLRDLMLGKSDPQATERMIARVTELTGLDAEFVRRSGGRIESGAYLRESRRSEQLLPSLMDTAVTMPDPFPWAPVQRAEDPLMLRLIAPTTSAMADFVTRIVGWKVDAHYISLNTKVNGLWEDFADGREPQVESAADLRRALSVDPNMRVLVAHGWSDLSCPFLASVLVVDQMPATISPQQVVVKEYAGGHMFYSRAASRLAFRKDVAALYR